MKSSEPKVSPEFTRLIAEQHQPLRSFIRSLGVDADWVDDLAQETFLVAWREQHSFDQEQDYGKWLRGIARNLIRNELRKQARHKRLLHRGLTELLLAAADPEPLEESWADGRMSILRDCVEKLAPKSRKLVAGRYSDGWKSPDLADLLDMTPAAVRKALMRIREQLKQCVELRLGELRS